MVSEFKKPKGKSLLVKLASPAFLKHKQEYVEWSKLLLQRAKESLVKEDSDAL